MKFNESFVRFAYSFGQIGVIGYILYGIVTIFPSDFIFQPSFLKELKPGLLYGSHGVCFIATMILVFGKKSKKEY